MRLCVVAGMIDAKLAAKLAPLQAIPEVERIDLIRRRPFVGDKVVSHIPPTSWRPLAELWRLAALFWLALRHRPAVLVAFGVVPHGIYVWWVGRLLGILVIQHVMGKNDLRLTFPGQRGGRLTLAAVKAGAAVAVRGARMKRWLVEQGMPEERIFVTQNLHDFSLFRPPENRAPSYDLIYVGLLDAYKRVDLMLEGFAQLRQQRPGATLLLVGDGSRRASLETLAAGLGIADGVNFAGRQSFEALPGLLADARVFIMTSQGEGLPQAMIEALSCGLPVVVPADADIEEVAEDGVNALLVRGPGPAAYAAAWECLLGDEALYRRLRGGALALREGRREEYSLEHQTRLWWERLLRLTRESR